VQLSQPINLTINSPDGCAGGPPATALVYNSGTVSDKPVVQL
jgi:hypothetical protein